MVQPTIQPTIIRNRIGYTLIRLQRQAALQVQTNIGTMACVNHILSYLATLVAYSSSRVKLQQKDQDVLEAYRMIDEVVQGTQEQLSISGMLTF